MYLTIAITTIGAMATFAYAAPFYSADGPTSAPFTRQSSPMLDFDATANFDTLEYHVAMSKAKMLRSYEMVPKVAHPSVVLNRSLSRGHEDASRVELTCHDKKIWYGTISIGTPPKLFSVQFDTGSTDLFVLSSTCGAHCQGHTNLWDTDSSKSARNLDRTFRLHFADGGIITGEQYTDNVTVAGFTADLQTIGAATEYAPNRDVSLFPPDGLVGMAFQSFSRFPARHLFGTLLSEGKVPEPVFSFQLSSDGGELYIGGSNTALYTGRIAYADVTKQGVWEVNMDKVQINGKTILSNVDVVIDTGSFLIFGDSERVLTLHKAWGGKAYSGQFYTFPCRSFPSITLTFGAKPFRIPAEVLNRGPIQDGSPDCISGIVAHQLPDLSSWTIGNIFLQHVYTIFNLSGTTPRVGFAKLRSTRNNCFGMFCMFAN